MEIGIIICWRLTSVESNMKKDQHVVPHGEEWAVKREGAVRATSLHSTQAEAMEVGRKIAQNQSSELFIHGRNGRIRDRDSFGNDPFPPRDQKF